MNYLIGSSCPTLSCFKLSSYVLLLNGSVRQNLVGVTLATHCALEVQQRSAYHTSECYWTASAIACTIFDVPKTAQPHSVRIVSDSVPTR